MRTLVIPDIHQQVEAVDNLLDRESSNYDSVVFLGDYFDAYVPQESASETALWLVDLMKKNPSWTFLLGNHDIGYVFSPGYQACSGFQPDEFKFVNSTLAEVRNRFKLCHFAGSYLFSHAGLTDLMLPEYLISREEKKNWITEKCTQALDCAFGSIQNAFLKASHYRGGDARVPGITWCDFNEFYPIPDINQVFGHTAGYVVREKHSETSYNFCIDCRTTKAAIHDDGASTEFGEIQIIEWNQWLTS